MLTLSVVIVFSLQDHRHVVLITEFHSGLHSALISVLREHTAFASTMDQFAAVIISNHA